MPEPVDLSFALRLAPADFVDYLRRRGFDISFNWFDVWQEANARAFTVAKAGTQEILQVIHGELSGIISEGLTERQFIDRLTPVLQDLGWWGIQEVTPPGGVAQKVLLGSPGRLSHIYRTNLSVSLQVGRYRRQIENTSGRPWWQYISLVDGRERPEHRALHLRVWRFDDPIWRLIYPPNDHGCRCRVGTHSDFSLERNGFLAENSEGHLSTELGQAGIDRTTGEVIMAPVTVWRGVDAFGQPSVFRTGAGWNYNPGAAWLYDQAGATL